MKDSTSESPVRSVTTRDRTRSRRFNASVIERPQNSKPRELFTLQDTHIPYIDKRSRAEVLHSRNFSYALLNAVLSLVVILGTFVENELVYYEEIQTIQAEVVRMAMVLCSILQMLLTVQIARTRMNLLKLLGAKHPNSTVHSASLVEDKSRLGMLAVMLVHLCVLLPPGASFPSELVNFITLCTFFRLIHIGIFIYSQSPLFLPRAQFYT